MAATPAGKHMSRRTVLGLALGAATTPVLTACGGLPTNGASGPGTVTFMSTQFGTVEERQRFESILKTQVKGVNVAFNPVLFPVWDTTIRSQTAARKVSVDLLGGLHGDLAPYADSLADLDGLMAQLSDRGFASRFTSLSKFGGTTTKYIPWMQASYVLAVNKKALRWLPSGADVQSLTYDQLLAWATAGMKATSKPIFGFPAGPMGLYHRFFQGFLLPSFTGGQVVTFRSTEAVQAWEFMKKLWAVTAPASTNYNFMQQPLATGEVLVAWDHTARLIDALGNQPQNWIAVPAPTGPKGLGYMLVVAGLSILKGAPAVGKAHSVIAALTEPATQDDVLRANAFFPVVGGGQLPANLPSAIALEAAAVTAQQSAAGAIVSLPPVGLGSQDSAFSEVYKDCFISICLQNKPIMQVLDAQTARLNAILKQANVPCWSPDASVTGQTCQVA